MDSVTSKTLIRIVFLPISTPNRCWHYESEKKKNCKHFLVVFVRSDSTNNSTNRMNEIIKVEMIRFDNFFFFCFRFRSQTTTEINVMLLLKWIRFAIMTERKNDDDDFMRSTKNKKIDTTIDGYHNWINTRSTKRQQKLNNIKCINVNRLNLIVLMVVHLLAIKIWDEKNLVETSNRCFFLLPNKRQKNSFMIIAL